MLSKRLRTYILDVCLFTDLPPSSMNPSFPSPSSPCSCSRARLPWWILQPTSGHIVRTHIAHLHTVRKLSLSVSRKLSLSAQFSQALSLCSVSCSLRHAWQHKQPNISTYRRRRRRRRRCCCRRRRRCCRRAAACCHVPCLAWVSVIGFLLPAAPKLHTPSCHLSRPPFDRLKCCTAVK
jgi:hypothetical protein